MILYMDKVYYEWFKEVIISCKRIKSTFCCDEDGAVSGTGIFLKKFFDTVAICSDGEEGLVAFSKERDFDVIITDILMPILDDIEMTKEIRKLIVMFYHIFNCF